MIPASVGHAFLADQLDLIREIGRNIAGTPPERAQTAGPATGMGGTSPAPVGLAPEEHSFDRWKTHDPALSLVGLRHPNATMPGGGAGFGAAAARLAQGLAQGSLPGGASSPSGETGAAAGGAAEQDGGAAGQQGAVDTARAGSAAAAGYSVAVVRQQAMMNIQDAAAATAAGSRAEGDQSAASRAPSGQSPNVLGSSQGTVQDAATSERAALAAARSDVQVSTHSRHTDPRSGDAGSLVADEQAGSARHVGSATAGTQAAQLIERGLLALALAEAAPPGVAAPLQERAGIIASFILNAHFLPGWPPPRPIQSVEAKAFAERAASTPKLTKSETETLVYLANLGFNKEQLARMMKLLLRARRRSGLLDAIAEFFTNLGMVMTTLQEELETVIEELNVEWQTRPGAAAGKRSRLELR